MCVISHINICKLLVQFTRIPSPYLIFKFKGHVRSRNRLLAKQAKEYTREYDDLKENLMKSLKTVERLSKELEQAKQKNNAIEENVKSLRYIFSKIDSKEDRQ